MAAPQLIALMGAECTGKTTLAQALAAHFGGLWVPEALREFCQQQQRTPRMDEQLGIMQAQCTLEEQALGHAWERGHSLVFCDTTPLMTALYSDYYFGDASLLEFASEHQWRYALTLVLRPDLAWQFDGFQRDSEQVRSRVDAQLMNHLKAGCYPYLEVNSQGAQRLQNAILAVESFRGN